MKRISPYLGAFMFLVVGLYFLAFPGSLAEPSIVLQMGVMVIAGALLIVGALRDTVGIGSRTFDWNVLVGAAFVLLGVSVGGSMIQSAFSEPGMIGWILGICAIVGFGSLIWFGVQTALDTRHVELDAEPSNARLVGVVLFAVVSFLGGMAMWSFVL